MVRRTRPRLPTQAANCFRPLNAPAVRRGADQKIRCPPLNAQLSALIGAAFRVFQSAIGLSLLCGGYRTGSRYDLLDDRIDTASLRTQNDRPFPTRHAGP